MNKILRFIFFNILVRFVVYIVIGLNVRNRQNLPKKGPAILVANHNSHLDTLVLMTLLPRRLLPLVRPVAAFDYFLRNRLLAWFSLNIIRIVPLKRTIDREARKSPLTGCFNALEQGDILIVFPEGTRGEPERVSNMKSGIAHLAQKYPNVPIIPIFMHGLGKALPRGESLLVPFFCDVYVGEALPSFQNKEIFMTQLEDAMHKLAEQAGFPTWD